MTIPEMSCLFPTFSRLLILTHNKTITLPLPGQSVWVFVISACCVLMSPTSTLHAKPPNVVILYADDMGYGDLACQNPESKIPTPNLDRLAREGIRFTDSHSSSGICTPSRYALLTGRYHWRKFHEYLRPFEGSVFDDEETLAEMLRAKGYSTVCFGKWHLGWDWSALKTPQAKPHKTRGYAPEDFDWSRAIADGPLAHGFDEYFGVDVPNYPPYAWIENDRLTTRPTVDYAPNPIPREGSDEGAPGPMTDGWRLDLVLPTLAERVVSWIDKQKGSDKPFFLYFALTSVHTPIVPTDDFRGKSQAGEYGDFVVQTDAVVGEIMAALERIGQAENTLIYFSSDNGTEGYAFERVRNFNHRSMGSLRGVKQDIWEGGHRVPTIIRWPVSVKPNQVSHALVSQIDLMATVADIVGCPLPATSIDSVSFLPILLGETNMHRQSLVHNTWPGAYAIRMGDWVLVDTKSGEHTPMPKWFRRSGGYPKDTGAGLLFNLREDLGQKNNLFGKHPEKVAELRKELQRIRAEK